MQTVNTRGLVATFVSLVVVILLAIADGRSTDTGAVHDPQSAAARA